MNIKHRILTAIILCALGFSACAPAPTQTQPPVPTATVIPTPTLRPEQNVSLNKPIRVSASWVVDPLERAVDGNVNNWWGAGGVAPQWIEIDLQGIYVVSKINVVEGPTARAIYQVFGRGPDGVNHPLHTFDVLNSGMQYLTYVPEMPLEDISTIRVEITNSGSGWVGIREIQVFSRQDPDPLPVAGRSESLPFQAGVDWDVLEPIIPENAIFMEQLSMLGRGIVNDLAWSPDGKTIAAASSVGVWLYDAADLNATPRFLEGHTRDVLSVAFTSEGQTLLSASQDGTVKVWDVATGGLQRTVHLWDDFSHEVGTSPREKEVWSTAFSPDGSLLAAGSYDGTVRFWNVTTGTARTAQKQHSKQVSRLAFSPDGSTLASGSVTGEVFLWDVVTGGQRFILSGHKSLISDLTFTPDGTMLASTAADGLLEVWVTASGEMLSLLGGGTSAGLSAAFNPAGTILASCGSGGDIRFYDLEKFNPNEYKDAASMFKENAGLVMHMAFNPDGSKLASSTYDGVLQIWESASSELTQSQVSHTSPVNGISFSPTGKFLATASDDSLVRVWDVEKNALGYKLVGHAGKVTGVAFSPDGLTLASGSFDKTVILWDAKTVTKRAVLAGHSSYVRSVAFSPDSKLVASGSTDKTVRLWDAATGTERTILTGHTAEVETVAFSQDGTWLLSGSADKTLRIWEVATGKEMGSWEGNGSFVLGAAFSPTGSLISAVGGDFSMRVFNWNVMGDQTTSTLKFPPIGTGGWDMATTFSPDGLLVASAANSTSAFYVTPGEIHLYRSDTGFPVNLLRGPTKRVLSVTFSPNGKLLASAGADGAVRLWGVVNDSSRPAFVPTVAPPTSAAPTVTPAATAPWRDDFDGSLAEGWRWVRENPAKWNLTENPGFLRIYDSPYQANGKTQNLLLRNIPGPNFIIETHVIFRPEKNYQFAGLSIYQDDGNLLSFGRAFCNNPGTCVGNGIYFDSVTGGAWAGNNFATSVTALSDAYLRLERRGDTVTAFFSYDGMNWSEIGGHVLPSGFLVTGIGVIASGDVDKSDADTAADFDYFTVSQLP